MGKREAYIRAGVLDLSYTVTLPRLILLIEEEREGDRGDNIATQCSHVFQGKGTYPQTAVR